MNAVASRKHSWPYLRTPLAIYLLVMVPIGGLQCFILLNNFPVWMQLSAAGVLLLSLYGLLRGYCRRLVLTDTHAELRGLFSGIRIERRDVKRFGSYLPGGGLGATRYVFISREDAIPAGTWQIDARVIQVQDRDGLPEAIQDWYAKTGVSRPIQPPTSGGGLGVLD